LTKIKTQKPNSLNLNKKTQKTILVLAQLMTVDTQMGLVFYFYSSQAHNTAFVLPNWVSLNLCKWH